MAQIARHQGAVKDNTVSQVHVVAISLSTSAVATGGVYFRDAMLGMLAISPFSDIELDG